jgi:hypothetical protein
MQPRFSPSEAASQSEEPLLLDNLVRVFNERDRKRRRAAIAELYAPDAVVYEPGSAATGYQAIDEKRSTRCWHISRPPSSSRRGDRRLATTASRVCGGHRGRRAGRRW